MSVHSSVAYHASASSHVAATLSNPSLGVGGMKSPGYVSGASPSIPSGSLPMKYQSQGLAVPVPAGHMGPQGGPMMSGGYFPPSVKPQWTPTTGNAAAIYKSNLASTLGDKRYATRSTGYGSPSFPGLNVGPSGTVVQTGIPSGMQGSLAQGPGISQVAASGLQQPAGLGYPQPAPSSHGTSADMSVSNSGIFQKRISMGMNQAVSYLRKIQQRFINSPEIYSSFVEILRSYQRDQRELKQVKEQVASLFVGHPDLFEEFSQFIPDVPVDDTPPISTVGPVAGATDNAKALARKSAQQMVQETLRSGRYGGKRAAAVFGTSPPDSIKKPKVSADGDRSVGELEFFDKVKAHLNHNEQLYGEFLKCLNWYTLDILKKKELVKLVHGFIGRSNELFTWFKTFIGFSESEQDEEYPAGRGAAKKDAEIVDAYSVDLLSCKRLFSYRFLPKNYEHSVCSGRTILCQEVLNDNLVSCPSFTSEDSTFVSSKKNQYEEALFRAEDERYELDLLIDGNQATIANFEPILKKLSLMSTKEAEKYTLNDALGGHSEVIYKNIIKKVYGDKSDEVIDALKRTPYVSVPVVLKRLKQKDEEWRMDQREWNRVWREIHFKNYYKALDHLGISFKTTDKKILSGKNLVNEIQTVFYEWQQGESNISSSAAALKQNVAEAELGSDKSALVIASKLPSCQGMHSLKSSVLENPRVEPMKGDCLLSFEFNDIDLLDDLLKLMLFQISRSSTFGGVDKKSIEKFLFNFLSDFFPFSIVHEPSNDKSIGESRRYSRRNNNDGLDESSNEDDDYDDEFGGPYPPSKTTPISDFKLVPKLSDEAAKEQRDGKSDSGLTMMLANEPVYILFRLLQIAYHRLAEMKVKAKSFQESPLFYHKKNYIASYLELSKRPASDISLDSDFFRHLIELLKSLIDGSVDQGTFEERVRLMFGANGYLIFTFDRLLYSILRQCAFILSDSNSQHIVALYDSWKRPKNLPALPKPLDSAQYLQGMKALIGSVPNSSSINIFNITANVKRPNSDIADKPEVFYVALSFGFLTQELGNSLDPSLSQVSEATRGTASFVDGVPAWQQPCIDEFLSIHSNPKLLHQKPPLMLVNYLKEMDEAMRLQDMTIDYNLECKICLDNCRLIYVKNTEDFVYKPPRSDEEKGDNKELHSQEASDKANDTYPEKCIQRFRDWLNKRLGANESLHLSSADSPAVGT